MKIPEEIRKRLPGLGSARQANPMHKWIALARCVDPETRISWYLIEFDGQDRFFGLMVGKHSVAGEFSLAELQALGAEGDEAGGVYLDNSFQPTALIELARQNSSIAELLPPPSEGLVDLVP
ncbi:MAG: hypothetical protein V3T83_06030 [Acidobacteriota bacterium]